MAERRVASTEDGEDCRPAKRVKLDEEEKNDACEKSDATAAAATAGEDGDDDAQPSAFKLTRILRNNCERKFMCVEGTFEDRAGKAIVLLEQKSFPNDKQLLEKSFFDEKTVYRKICTNDVYGNYDCFPTAEHNSVHVTVIHPASQRQVEKYERQEKFYMVDETYELYQKVTLPHIESMSLTLEWITNILEHKAEQENIIYEDTDKENGFILVTDLKWDKRIDTLKLLALPFKKIRSLRELNASHLPLLRNIRDAGTEAISKKFNIPASQLRIYFHYLPSYYYLHVHFCYLMYEAPGIYVEKAHLLSTVIRNLELMSDYYKNAVLSYIVCADRPLYKKFKSLGILKV